ncbi:MAG: acyltransferase [Bacilli bacterium]|nr:acyltransferase [Bacilli bacterium]
MSIVFPSRHGFRPYHKYSLDFFNVLRIFGIIMISCLYHVRKDIDLFAGNSFALFFKANSTIFVSMFFLMSGILFYYVYYRRMLLNKVTYKQFLKQRLDRFFPICLLTTTFVFLVCFICYKCDNPITDDISFVRYVFSILLLNPYSISTGLPTGFNLPLWYLLVLFILHVVACIITYIVSTKEHTQQWLWLFFMPIVVGVIGYAIFRGGFTFCFWNEDISIGLMTFFVGFYLGVYFNYFMSFTAKEKNIVRIIALVLLVIALYFAIDTLVIEYAPEGYPIPNIDLAVIFGVFIFPLLFITLFDVKWFNKICGIKPIHYFAEISMWAFIFNYPIIYLFKATGAFNYLSTINDWWAFLLLIAVSYGVAAICEFVRQYLRKKFHA